MITVATVLWDANAKSHSFSRCYDESWVTKLYGGFARNLTRSFRFVLFTDRLRALPDCIDQRPLLTKEPDYGCCVAPFKLNDPMIFTGLDTVIVGNVDHLADYCLTQKAIALPIDPFKPNIACNGVVLAPAGNRAIYDEWRGENDMEWMRSRPHALIDDLFPGQVVSYKGHVKACGLGDARIVYFHGQEKPHELAGVDWVARHWR